MAAMYVQDESGHSADFSNREHLNEDMEKLEKVADLDVPYVPGTYIPATQRPDGTWRKARRVRDGYIPQDEMPLYESKGKQWAKNRPSMPVGYNPVEETKIPSSAHGNTTSKTIPGLTEPESVSKSSKKKKKKKKSDQQKEQTLCESLEKTHISSNEKPNTNGVSPSENSVKKQPITPDPMKRIRNLKKKLREIDSLKQKIESGELANPEKDQLEKIARREEIEAEIEELEFELEKS